MFKQLRNKFLLLNLITISLMMLMAFASIYVITYNNIRSDRDMELHRLADLPPKPLDARNPLKDGQNKNQAPPHPMDIQPQQERSVSFTLITDNSWNLLGAYSVIHGEKEFFEAAKTAALAQKNFKGSLKLEGNHWAFLILPQSNGYRMVFLDITPQQAILNNLIYTFLTVALVMLIVIYFISRFFANKSIQPIKEAFDKQKQFIADASHELKTPLAVINTNVDVLLSGADGSLGNHSKWLHYIKSEAERMNKLTNDLLYLTQMDYSDIKMISASFDLSEAVESVLLTMEAVIFERGIQLQYELEPGLMGYGSCEQIKQVVMILLDNAVKYTDPKGSIQVSLKGHYNNLLLHVTNTGEGIPEEHLTSIFDRFYRTDKSRTRQRGGYGLGLAIAKAIVEQHNGKIWVKSIPHEHTSFIVELPAIHA
jgi:two-component system sensor histidine kinase CiaH